MGFRRLPFAFALVATAIALSSSRPAAASEPPAPYTDEVLIADGVSAAAIGGSYVLYSRGEEKVGKPLLGLGVVSYIFGVPIVHLVHRQGLLSAVISLVARFAAPMAVLGLVTSTKPSESVGMTLVAAGFAAPMALDAAVLARPSPPPRLHDPDAPETPATHVESRPRWEAIGLGGAGLVASYGLWLAVVRPGAAFEHPPASYYVPVLGPTLVTGKLLSTRSDYPGLIAFGAFLTGTVAVAQGASIAAIAFGFLSPRKVVVEDRPTALHVQPFIGAGTAGIAGTF